MARVDVIAYSPQGMVEEAHVTFARCLELLEKYPVTWINVVALEAGDLPQLEAMFNLHPIALEDALHPSQIPKVDEYDEEVFIVTKTIRLEDGLKTDQLSMFLSKKFVLTAHARELPQVEEVRQRIRKGSPRILRGGADYLCLNILDAVVDSYTPVMDQVGEMMDELEESVLEAPRKEVLHRIHEARRTLLNLRKEINPQREALHNLWRTEVPWIRRETRGYIRDVYDHTVLFLEYLETYRELTADVFEIYLSEVQLTLNEVIKLLTVIATITLPLIIIAGLWGMNFTSSAIPLYNNPYGFWYVVGFMVVLTGILTFYFRRRGWI